MLTVERYDHGMFCWVDLVTHDAQAAKTFYTALFDWQVEDVPAGEGMTYTMCRHRGEDACGLYAMNDEMRAQGIPPHWASYVCVDDADAAAKRAQALGATVPGPPFDVMDVGRMAMLQDPTGAWFNIWQPGRHIGATVVNRPHTWSWNELATRDTAAAAAFYGELFGWTHAVTDGAKGPYTSFSLDGRLVGGMLEITPEWGEVPPNWGVYFAVEDCAAAAARVGAIGGKVLVPETPVPDVGRFAVVSDTQGAAFSVIAMDVADPPPGHSPGH